MNRSFSVRTLAFCLIALFVAPAAHADQPILTVTGDIGKSNRGAFDPFADALFGKFELTFDKAYVLTYDDLKALPQTTLSVRYANWPAEVDASGPLLKDVLALIEARGDTVIVRAVDGYAPEFSRQDVDNGQFVLALDADGKPLAIGGRGPVWLVYPPGSIDDQPETDDGLTWAAFHVEIRK